MFFLFELINFFKKILFPLEDFCIHPIHDPGHRITILSPILNRPYEFLFIWWCIHYMLYVFFWKNRNPLFFFFKYSVPLEKTTKFFLWDFYRIFPPIMFILYSVWIMFSLEYIPEEDWMEDNFDNDAFYEEELFDENYAEGDSVWRNDWDIMYICFFFKFFFNFFFIISTLYFFIFSFLLNSVLSSLKLNLFLNIFEKKKFFFPKMLFDFLLILSTSVLIYINIDLWYINFRRLKFIEKYVDFCENIGNIFTTIFSEDFFLKLIVVYTTSSVVSIFFFNSLYHNIYFASWRYQHAIKPLRKFNVSNLASRYAFHYKSFIKYLYFKKFKDMFTVSIKNFHKRFHKWGDWNYYMKFFVKQKLKVKWYTRYFKLKINIGYFWTRNFFQYRSKHTRRRRRINHNQYRRWLKEHRRIRWNSWLTKIIGSVGNPGRFIRIRKKCGYIRSRVTIRRSATAIWVGNGYHFAHDRSMARIRLYGYMRMVYWGKDSPAYCNTLLENLYSRTFPNSSSWSLFWLYPQADIFRWTKPYVLRNITYSSPRYKCYDSFIWQNPRIFMTRYRKTKSWHVHSDFFNHYYDWWTDTRLAKFIKRYVICYLWRGVVPTLKDYYDISSMDLESSRFSDVGDIVSNFLKN